MLTCELTEKPYDFIEITSHSSDEHFGMSVCSDHILHRSNDLQTFIMEMFCNLLENHTIIYLMEGKAAYELYTYTLHITLSTVDYIWSIVYKIRDQNEKGSHHCHR